MGRIQNRLGRAPREMGMRPIRDGGGPRLSGTAPQNAWGDTTGGKKSAPKDLGRIPAWDKGRPKPEKVRPKPRGAHSKRQKTRPGERKTDPQAEKLAFETGLGL